MKIGILGTARPFRGGIAQFLHNMADELAKEHEVVVFNFIKQYPRLFFPGKGQVDESLTPPLTPFKKEGVLVGFDERSSLLQDNRRLASPSSLRFGCPLNNLKSSLHL